MSALPVLPILIPESATGPVLVGVKNPIYTSYVGHNAATFAGIARLYFPPHAKVLDATFGAGAFWRMAKDYGYQLTTADIQQRPGVMIVADARSLPFPDQSFDVVVLDPPYMRGCGSPNPALGRDMTGRYGLLTVKTKVFGWKSLMKMYSEMIVEAQRVVVPGGHVIVKGMDDRQDFFVRDLIIPKGLKLEAVHIVTTTAKPIMRHDYQIHARKNHSYFLVLKRGKR